LLRIVPLAPGEPLPCLLAGVATCSLSLSRLLEYNSRKMKVAASFFTVAAAGSASAFAPSVSNGLCRACGPATTTGKSVASSSTHAAGCLCPGCASAAHPSSCGCSACTASHSATCTCAACSSTSLRMANHAEDCGCAACGASTHGASCACSACSPAAAHPSNCACASCAPSAHARGCACASCAGVSR